TPGPRCASSRHSPRESRSVAPRPRCGGISRRSVRMGSSTPEAADPSAAVSSELIDTLERGRRQFLALVDHVRPELLRYCTRMTGSVADGEDVVQETLARACYEGPVAGQPDRRLVRPGEGPARALRRLPAATHGSARAVRARAQAAEQPNAGQIADPAALGPMAIEPHLVIGNAIPMITNMPPHARLKLLPTRSSSGRMRCASLASRYSTTNSIATKLVAMTTNWISRSRRG